MKTVYVYALFFGAVWGLAVGLHNSFVEITCLFFTLIGWAAVCDMDKNV